MRDEAPSVRVRRALTRITRNRWVSGKEIYDIARKLSKLASPACHASVLHHALPSECEVVGMWRGVPPAMACERHYRKMMTAIGRKRTSENATAEIAILTITLEAEKRGHMPLFFHVIKDSKHM